MEVLVADEYMLAFDYIGSLPVRPSVIDLGANIGLFSLLCVHRNGSAMVDAYEPAPPNCDRFLENLSLNTSLGNRITLHLDKKSLKIGSLHGKNFLKCRFP